jgi:hypothetical protein
VFPKLFDDLIAAVFPNLFLVLVLRSCKQSCLASLFLLGLLEKVLGRRDGQAERTVKSRAKKSINFSRPVILDLQRWRILGLRSNEN